MTDQRSLLVRRLYVIAAILNSAGLATIFEKAHLQAEWRR